MAEKKKENKKADAKAIAKSTIKAPKKTPKRAQSNTRAKASVKKEEVYPAVQIAEMFGISDFVFYMIKEANNLNDGSLLTVSEFQKYHIDTMEGR